MNRQVENSMSPASLAWSRHENNKFLSGYANSRDVRNSFFILVRFLKLRFGSEWVWFGSVQKMQFVWDIIVINYSCNSGVVNLQQILQRQWITWLWCHSPQWRLNNIIAFWNLYATLCFGCVLKHSLSAHLMQAKLLLFEWRIACSFYRKTIWTDVKF